MSQQGNRALIREPSTIEALEIWEILATTSTLKNVMLFYI